MILFIAEKNTDSDLIIKSAIGKYLEFCKNAYIDDETDKMLENLNVDSKTFVNNVKIVRGGKPYLEYNGERMPLKFSLSHTDGLTVVGVSHSEVGVDCERWKERDYVGIARRENFGFTPISEEEFYDEWTRREAVAKYYGKGFSHVKQKIDAPKVTNLKFVYNCSIAVVSTENLLVALLT